MAGEEEGGKADVWEFSRRSAVGSGLVSLAYGRCHDLAGPYVCQELVLFPGRYEYIWTIETTCLGFFAGLLSKQRAKLKVSQYKGKLSTKHKRKITF